MYPRPRTIAERAAQQPLLNSFLRETGVHIAAAGATLRVPLPESGAVLLGSLRY